MIAFLYIKCVLTKMHQNGASKRFNLTFYLL